jgi:hypothetical protein
MNAVPHEFNPFFIGDQIVVLIIATSIIIIMHGLGMLGTMAVASSFNRWIARHRALDYGVSTLIVASLIIITVHFLEVTVWAQLFYWAGAIRNASDSFYFTTLQYVTVGSSINLPFRWRNLEGAVAMTGLLTFAWSTGVLMTLVGKFQSHVLQAMRPHHSQ